MTDRSYDESLAAQLTERIRNAITAVNRVRAKHLDNVRLESMLTQLEDAIDRIEQGRDYTYAERDALDFHLTEGSPLEGDLSLEQELYSLKNILDKLAVGTRRIDLL